MPVPVNRQSVVMCQNTIVDNSIDGMAATETCVSQKKRLYEQAQPKRNARNQQATNAT